MFDSLGSFAKLFTPIDGGFLFYPSAKAGGKLITAEEYARLTLNWQRVAGRRGRWKLVGVVMLVLVLWEVVAQSLNLPTVASWLVIGVCVAAIVARICWVSFAPRRLVKGRPEIAPP